MDPLSGSGLIKAAIVMRPIRERCIPGHEVGLDFYARLVAVHSVVSGYTMVTMPELAYRQPDSDGGGQAQGASSRDTKHRRTEARKGTKKAQKEFAIRIGVDVGAAAQGVTPDYLRYKLYGNANVKVVSLADHLNFPVLNKSRRPLRSHARRLTFDP